MQLGPNTRSPYLWRIMSICSSSRLPASPVSLNPAEIITTPSTPASPLSSTTAGTVGAGVAITARSTCSGTFRIDGWQGRFKAVSWFGLTA
ncbi:MAG: hypothetical protein QXY84_05565 [Candidatus Caldarchaeum sp.]